MAVSVCSVNYLSINGRESLLYSRATTYEVFLAGYSTLNNDYVTFYIRHVTFKCEKKIRNVFRVRLFLKVRFLFN